MSAGRTFFSVPLLLRGSEQTSEKGRGSGCGHWEARTGGFPLETGLPLPRAQVVAKSRAGGQMGFLVHEQAGSNHPKFMGIQDNDGSRRKLTESRYATHISVHLRTPEERLIDFSTEGGPWPTEH